MNKRIVLLLLLFIFGKSYGQYSDSIQATPIIPYWAFGHWIWEDERNTSDAVKELTDGYKKHNIPVDALIVDSPWMIQYNDFVWDKGRYPRPQKMIDQLHDKGIKVLSFYTGCLNSLAFSSKVSKCKTYNFAVDNNFCVNQNQESMWFKGPGVHVDMTNKLATNWWHTQVDVLHTMNLDGAKIDFGFAWFGDSIQTFQGLLSRREFGYHYYADAFDYNVSQNPEFVAMTYAWSGRGLMGFPSKSHVNWVGDFRGDWQGIKDQLRNIYRSANYGFSGIACEIGGYWKVPSNKEQFIRYAQLASLCPIMVNGGALGAFEHHLPWRHDKETVDIYRKYVALHKELSPYLFSASVDAHINHTTIIKNADIENENHLLGDQLFVKVISDSLQTVTIKMPNNGNWIDFWNDDKVYEAGATIDKMYQLSRYPLFIRSGAIIPLQVENDLLLHGRNSSVKKTTFLIYPEGKSTFVFHKPKDDGIQYDDVTITVNEKKGSLSLDSQIELDVVFLIKYNTEPSYVEGAERFSYNSESNLLRIDKSGSSFEIEIN